MAQTKVHRILRGIRGHPGVDFAALEDVIVRFSDLVLAHPRIVEADINPLLATPTGIIALDARIVLR
ncbi:MAG: acetate--CoA ligase family protein [Verrucomicrobiaceae bacterium]|nr:acetate--CoA ligase family protein [Verrucomicrobiaceae bacterium]